MPTHFGPAPGPRQLPDGVTSDQSKSPKRTLVSAHFRTDPACLERHLPEDFILLSPVVSIDFHYMTEIDWLAGRGYTMINVSWPVTFRGSRDRVSGRFLAVVWENLADPIITGRCEIGHPKLFAESPALAVRNGTYECSAGWDGFRFLEISVGQLQEAAPPAADPAIEGTLMIKYVPRTGEWGSTDLWQVSFTPDKPNPVVVESRKSGKAHVRFNKARFEDLPTMYHVVNALADLPVLEVLQGSVIQSRGGKPFRDQRILR